MSSVWDDPPWYKADWFWLCAVTVGLITALGFLMVRDLSVIPPQQVVVCGISTPEGIVPTMSGEVKSPHITEFGVVRGNGFTYTPASGEVCLIKPAGEN